MRRLRLPALAALAFACALPAAAGPQPATGTAAGPLAAAAERIAGAADRIAAAGEALAATGEAGAHAGDRLAALGEAIEAYDGALAVLRDGVAEAAAREQAVGVDLSDRRQEISRLLAALETMSRTPQPAQAMHPQGPVGAARAAAMMAHLTPALQAQAEKLAGELAELQAARQLRIDGEARLRSGLVTLAGAQARLSDAMARANPADAGPQSPSATLLARDSATLTDLAAALARSAAAAPPAAAPSPGPSPYAWPVDGQVLRRFNEPDAARVRHPGIVVSASPFALVAAPADAIVRYAGPFLEYGYVVVLEPDPATMIVLAGLAQLRVETGAPVRRGELLGVLGGRPPGVEEYVMQPESETGADTGETLYIEIRRDRGPIDPEPLFARDNRQEENAR